ncbi:MAG: dicarboxylate/amino acid:cation symporter [Candidatus Liberibacter europaeus]|uniref:Dicarboxylate/amino acid:cation symporter n=1 Tax=Candidatus Liberibacter europaeus TaxID=744859 RepID=A0A2T4VYC9_9HYPH|nr:dicarboxylate/amino acid:cation symporter [Candidatus Liberibacter europaeus]PTL86787.1 MAG: dicarboxylate/amino acid:cation symporter [Candidatus Liberibacter europaeus]
MYNTSNLSLNQKKFLLYVASILVGIFSGMTDIVFFNELAGFISNAFVKIFKFISLPLISLSLIVNLSKQHPKQGMGRIWSETVLYAMITTMLAASVAMAIYNIISPSNVVIKSVTYIPSKNNYLSYISSLVPDNLLYPFLNGQVITILAICLCIAIAIRFIKNEQAKDTTLLFFTGMHSIFLIITGWIMKIIPIAMGAFIASTILQIRSGSDIAGLGEYLSTIVLANIVQGIVILPIFLYLHGLNPLKVARGMMPAILVAFFSKSSTGTLPVTMRIAEQNLNVSPQISRGILPFCTSINMNGCAAFIFVTVVYVMQNHGVILSFSQMLMWIPIAAISAAGNGGIPMGCFLLCSTLLSNMGVPVHLMGMILPFYTILDMLETALNVWSDACVTVVVDKHHSGLSDNTIESVGD